MKKLNLLIVIYATAILTLSGCGMFGGLFGGGSETPSVDTLQSEVVDSTKLNAPPPTEVDMKVKIKEVDESELKPIEETVSEEVPVNEIKDTIETTAEETIVSTTPEIVTKEQSDDSVAIAEAKRLNAAREITENVKESENLAIEEAKEIEKSIEKTEPEKIAPVKEIAKGKTSFASVKKYEATVSLVKSGNREAAIEQFNFLLSSEVAQDYADNCNYWIGEAKFGLKDYKGAIEYFKKVFQFKISEKKDDAQFMIARSYEKLGNAKQANLEFKKLVEMYPLSELVPSAQKRIK